MGGPNKGQIVCWNNIGFPAISNSHGNSTATHIWCAGKLHPASLWKSWTQFPLSKNQSQSQLYASSTSFSLFSKTWPLFPRTTFASSLQPTRLTPTLLLSSSNLFNIWFPPWANILPAGSHSLHNYYVITSRENLVSFTIFLLTNSINKFYLIFLFFYQNISVKRKYYFTFVTTSLLHFKRKFCAFLNELSQKIDSFYGTLGQ